MKVVKVEAYAHSACVGQPCGGWAYFDDGKCFAFDWHLINHVWYFKTTVKLCEGYATRRLFSSAKRAAALDAHFNK